MDCFPSKKRFVVKDEYNPFIKWHNKAIICKIPRRVLMNAELTEVFKEFSTYLSELDRENKAPGL